MAAAKPLKIDTATGKTKQMSSTDVIPIANLATGTPDGNKFVADDGTLKTPAGGGGGGSSAATKIFMYSNFY